MAARQTGNPAADEPAHAGHAWATLSHTEKGALAGAAAPAPFKSAGYSLLPAPAARPTAGVHPLLAMAV
jgi:hypothetical protein